MKSSSGNSRVLVQWIINCSIGELPGSGVAGGMVTGWFLVHKIIDKTMLLAH